MAVFEQSEAETDDSYDDEEEDDEITAEEIFDLAVDAMVRAVNAILRQPDRRTARRAARELRRVIRIVEDDWRDESTTQRMLLAYCLFGFQQMGRSAGEVINWVTDHLGPHAGAEAQLLGHLIGYPFAPTLPAADLLDRLDHETEAVMLWLAAGIVATAGDGDGDWLRKFVPYLAPFAR